MGAGAAVYVSIATGGAGSLGATFDVTDAEGVEVGSAGRVVVLADVDVGLVPRPAVVGHINPAVFASRLFSMSDR